MNRTPHTPNSFQEAKKLQAERRSTVAKVHKLRDKAAGLALMHSGVTQYLSKASKTNQKLVENALQAFAEYKDADAPFKRVAASALRPITDNNVKNLLWRALEDGERMARQAMDESTATDDDQALVEESVSA